MNLKQTIFILVIVFLAVLVDVFVTVSNPFYYDFKEYKNQEQVKNENFKKELLQAVAGYVAECQTNVVLKVQEYEKKISSITNNNQTLVVNGSNNVVSQMVIPEYDLDCQYMIVSDDEYIQIDGNIYHAGDDFEGYPILKIYPWGMRTEKGIYKRPRNYKTILNGESENGK